MRHLPSTEYMPELTNVTENQPASLADIIDQQFHQIRVHGKYESALLELIQLPDCSSSADSIRVISKTLLESRQFEHAYVAAYLADDSTLLATIEETAINGNRERIEILKSTIDQGKEALIAYYHQNLMHFR